MDPLDALLSVRLVTVNTVLADAGRMMLVVILGTVFAETDTCTQEQVVCVRDHQGYFSP